MDKINIFMGVLLFIVIFALLHFTINMEDATQQTQETLYCYESLQVTVDGACLEGYVKYMQKVGGNDVQTFCKMIYCVEGSNCHDYDDMCDNYEIVQKLP
jgi:hypothetical protein